MKVSVIPEMSPQVGRANAKHYIEKKLKYNFIGNKNIEVNSTSLIVSTLRVSKLSYSILSSSVVLTLSRV